MQDTAVLVFAQPVQQEALKKPLTGVHNYDANRGLWSVMHKHTLKCVKSSGLPVIHSSNQTGNSFGERITHAVEEAFKKGYQKLLVVGIDNPNLDAATLKTAAQTLAHNDYLLEPAADGGINIIGLTKKCFEATEFTSLPWKSQALFTTFLEQIHGRGQKVHILPVKQDIDTFKDLENWLESNTKNTTLCLLVQSLLYKYQLPKSPGNSFSEYESVLHLDAGRAPPYS